MKVTHESAHSEGFLMSLSVMREAIEGIECDTFEADLAEAHRTD